jgi:phosphatidylserine synthase
VQQKAPQTWTAKSVKPLVPQTTSLPNFITDGNGALGIVAIVGMVSHVTTTAITAITAMATK